jgi:hypothetical protein
LSGSISPYGRLATHEASAESQEQNQDPPNKQLAPFPVIFLKDALPAESIATAGNANAMQIAMLFGFACIPQTGGCCGRG